MKKIFLIILLLFFSFLNSFAEEKKYYNSLTLKNNFFIDFGNLEFKENHKDITFYNVKNILENNRKYFLAEVDKGPEILRKVSKEKLLDLIGENKIQIYGTNFRNCFGYECIFNPEKYTNSEIRIEYSVVAKEDKNIDIKVYPFNPNIYDYDSFEITELKAFKKNGEQISKEYEKFLKSPILTFFDSQLEIYDLKIDGSHKFFEKKYKVVRTKDGNYMYIPYFIGNVFVRKGENKIKIDYKKYIKLPGNDDEYSHFVIK